MDYGWVQPTLERISDILRMPDRNNSYGTPRIDPRHAWDAIQLVWPMTRSWTPAPVVSPTEKGGLEFVWAGVDTEVRVLADPLDPARRVGISIGGKAPGYLPGEFVAPGEALEMGLRVVERELGISSHEASPRP